MEIWIKDRNTGRVVKSSLAELKALGPNWRRINPPREIPRKVDQTEQAQETTQATEPEPTKQAIEPEKEEEPKQPTTRKEYLDALKELGVSKKGLHLYSLEKLKKEYEDATA